MPMATQYGSDTDSLSVAGDISEPLVEHVASDDAEPMDCEHVLRAMAR